MSEEEKPLVTWGEIAGHLNVSISKAQRLLRDHVSHVGNTVIIYPSSLKSLVEQGELTNNLEEHGELTKG